MEVLQSTNSSSSRQNATEWLETESGQEAREPPPDVPGATTFTYSMTLPARPSAPPQPPYQHGYDATFTPNTYPTVAGELSSTSNGFSTAVHPDEDWTRVSDLTERRRIQNRTAQRNYRKKIKERIQHLERRARSDRRKEDEKTPTAARDNRVMRGQPQAQDQTLSAIVTDPSSSPPQFSANRNRRSSPPPIATYLEGYSPPFDGVSPLSFFPGVYDLNDFDFVTELYGERHQIPLQNDSIENNKPVSKDGIDPDMPIPPKKAGHPAVEPSSTTPGAVASEEQFEGNIPASKISSWEDIWNMPELSRQRRVRSSKPKIKTGCGMCKQRRIKCDEARPACSNCVKSKKICPGYPSVDPKAGPRVYEGIRLVTKIGQDATSPLIKPQWSNIQDSALRDETDQRSDELFDSFQTEGRPNPHSSAANDTSLVEETPDFSSDDDTSVGSFAESVPEAELSSKATSASSFHGRQHVMVASFVDILVRDKNMDSLLAMATTEFGLSSGRFTKNLCRILRSYSRHLHQAVDSSSEQDNGHRLRCHAAAKLIHSARYQISGLVANRHKERAVSAPEHESRELISNLGQPVPADADDDDQPSSDEEDAGDEAEFAIAELEEFLVSGEPYRHLKRSLRSPIVPDDFLYCIDESARDFVKLLMTDVRTGPIVSFLRRILETRKDIGSMLTSRIRTLATDLQAECTGTLQMDVALFLEIYAQYLSKLAIDQVRPDTSIHSPSIKDHSPPQKLTAWSNTRKTGQTVSQAGKAKMVDHSSSSSISPSHDDDFLAPAHRELLENVLDEALPLVHFVDLAPHLGFLSSSAAFGSFLNSLQDLAVLPSFYSEARQFVNSIIREAETSGDRISILEGQRLLPLLSEMDSCAWKYDNGISFSTSSTMTSTRMLDRMKLAIESSTAAEWDWWPLAQPPRHQNDPDMAMLSWQCSCGTTRHESTLPHYAEALRIIHDKYPLDAAGGDIALTNRPASSLSDTSSQSAGSAQSGSSLSTTASSGQGSSISASTTGSALTVPDDGDDTLLNFGTGPRQYIYVFLLVRASEYALDTIDVSSMKARDFFKTLRATYYQQRGIWRRMFSVFVYNHCDFIKIIRPEPDTFMPGERKFELPSDHDDQYQYRPRPTYSAPVTKHMFHHYFYGCYDNNSLMHRLHAYLPMVPACRIRNPASELLEYFPKRDRKVAASAQSDKVEVCYGLVARECRSFFRVVVDLCLIMAPAFWFVFAWLFQWGNAGDLQDATVPLTLMLTVASVLWAVLYSGSDVRKDYGDG